MPGAVPRTSAFALNNVTLPFVKALADKGSERACADDPHLANGLNVRAGKIMHPAVAEALGVELAVQATQLVQIENCEPRQTAHRYHS